VSEVTPTTGANPDLVPASAWWRRPIGVHLALYALVLVALSAVGPVNGLFTSDEGAYLVQLELLDDGGWAFDYPLAEADPEGTWFPIINSDQGSGGERFPYVKHPLYVHLLDASTGPHRHALRSQDPPQHRPPPALGHFSSPKRS
jgi:hypothetical protein